LAKTSDVEEETRSDGYNPVVTANARPMLILQKSGVIYELLVPSMGRKMVAISGRLSYGSDNVVRRLREPTEEFIYALSGKLLIELASGEHVLSSGDSMYFEGNELLRMACLSEEEEAVWISVISPAVF
ncbi:MAG: cupin domain-containing protein, partial [Chloroflexi bacterium]|nr:cupin domain-containing protein [Chloroflexota bacterium]